MKLGIRTSFNRALLSIYPQTKIFFATHECAAIFFPHNKPIASENRRKKNAEKYFSALFSHTAKFFCGAWQTQARQEQ